MEGSYISVRRAPRKRRFVVDERVSVVVAQLAEFTGWPMWFAKNIVLWRKAQDLEWDAFREAR